MNLFFCLFGDGISPEKKMTETASLCVAHDAEFPSFFSGDTPSQTKQMNSFLII
jgi:hypothetical protein